MTQRIVETEQARQMLVKFIVGHELPMTVNVTTGGHRTIKQNRLNRLWMTEIAEQIGGWKAEDARAYCKLTIGVPILRAENDEFRQRYDEIVRPLPYETKISLMSEPLDFPVTRLMSVKQQKKYMDEVFKHFSEKGVVLTIPDDHQDPGSVPSLPADDASSPLASSQEPEAETSSPASGSNPEPADEPTSPDAAGSDSIPGKFSFTERELVDLKDFTWKCLEAATQPDLSEGARKYDVEAFEVSYRRNALSSPDASQAVSGILKVVHSVCENPGRLDRARKHIASEFLSCNPKELEDRRHG